MLLLAEVILFVPRLLLGAFLFLCVAINTGAAEPVSDKVILFFIFVLAGFIVWPGCYGPLTWPIKWLRRSRALMRYADRMPDAE